jgi:peroxiredoxin Q/BCP
MVGWTLATLSSSPLAADLKPGDVAPAFELLDQHSETHRLADYRGQWLVLYFYPKDDTPGCTTEACEFRDDVGILKRMGVALLGVSTDDVKSHREFAQKYHLPFSLLSDARGDVARQYGSLTSLGPLKFAKRHTFVIDPDGRIARIYRDVSPKRHTDEVIADLEKLHKLRAQQRVGS